MNFINILLCFSFLNILRTTTFKARQKHVRIINKANDKTEKHFEPTLLVEIWKLLHTLMRKWVEPEDL